MSRLEHAQSARALCLRILSATSALYCSPLSQKGEGKVDVRFTCPFMHVVSMSFLFELNPFWCKMKGSVQTHLGIRNTSLSQTLCIRVARVGWSEGGAPGLPPLYLVYSNSLLFCSPLVIRVAWLLRWDLGSADNGTQISNKDVEKMGEAWQQAKTSLLGAKGGWR